MSKIEEMAKQIIAYRKDHGMNQIDFAQVQGLSQSTVSRHESASVNLGRVEDYLHAGAKPEDFDQMIYGIESRPEESWKLREYFKEGEKDNLRMKEEIRFQMENSTAVQEKFGRELKAMQMESMMKNQTNYSVFDNLKFQSGKSWEELAGDAQMSKRTLRRYVSGESSPKMVDLFNLCEAFHTIPSVLISNSIYQDYLLEIMFQSMDQTVQNRLSAYLKRLMKEKRGDL